MSRCVVFDTTTVVSALLFTNGRLAWLRQHWKEAECIPLLSQSTAAELTRVLGYPKFHLSQEDRRELLADYMPYCEIVEQVTDVRKPVGMKRTSRFLIWLRAVGPTYLSVAIAICWRWWARRSFSSKRQKPIVLELKKKIDRLSISFGELCRYACPSVLVPMKRDFVIGYDYLES